MMEKESSTYQVAHDSSSTGHSYRSNQSVQVMEYAEIDLFDLIKLFWSSKWLIIVITLFFGIATAVYSLSLPNIYKAETLLAPADDDSATPTTLMSQFGGLANLAGVSLGGGDNVTKAIATLKSRQFIKYFIDKYDLKASLLASKWDSDLGESVVDPEKYDVEKGGWLNERGEIDPKAIPTDWEAYEEFAKILMVNEDSKTGLVSLSIEWFDPVQAKNWSNWLVKEVNNQFKKQDREEAAKSIEFLQNQLQRTQLVDMQKAFYQLIEQQTKMAMLADVRDSYVFSVIDVAVIPEDRSKPRRSLMTALGLVFGGMVAVAFVLISNIASSQLRRRSF